MTQQKKWTGPAGEEEHKEGPSGSGDPVLAEARSLREETPVGSASGEAPAPEEDREESPQRENEDRKRSAGELGKELVTAFSMGLSCFTGISPEAMYRRLHQRTEIVQVTEGGDDLLEGTGFEALNPEILPKSELDED